MLQLCACEWKLGRRERGPGEPDITEGERVWERQTERRNIFGEQTSECVELSTTVWRSVYVELSHEFGEQGIWRTDLIPSEDPPRISRFTLALVQSPELDSL